MYSDLYKTPVTVFDHPRNELPAKIKYLTPVASYSWIEREGVASLAIPGSPPIWREPQLPLMLDHDRGTTFVDQNSARCKAFGESPLMPLFTAVDQMEPHFSYSDIDIITDRCNLRTLLYWATKLSTPKSNFRTDVRMKDGKLFFFPFIEDECEEEIAAERAGAYGRSFESETTEVECKGQTGHYRIVKYVLGGLRMLVRFEVDAYLPPARSPFEGLLDDEDLENDNDGDDAKSLHSVSDSVQSSTKIPIVLTCNPMVPQESLMELKTIWIEKHLDWRHPLPQLYLSGTPHLIIARNQNGAVHQLEKHNVASGHHYWMEKKIKGLEKSLGLLAKILRDIRQAMKMNQSWGHGFALVGENGSLKLFRRKMGTHQRRNSEIVLDKFACF